MTCPVCGKHQPCAHSGRNAAVALDHQVVDEGAVLSSLREAQNRARQTYWREEVVSRVQQHRARRRRPADADASLELAFPAPDAATAQAPEPAASEKAQAEAPPGARVYADQKAGAENRPPAAPILPRKIIRFPRMVAAETALARPFVDELERADPAPATPRILDASEPQQMDLLAAFADIQLEERVLAEEDLGLPPQPAPMHLRVFSSLVDTAIVLAAAAMFVATFIKASGASIAFLRGRAAPLAVAAGVGIFWLLFQYIFLVYGRGTPGMRSAGLELCSFAGERPSLFARRCRALATMFSVLSLGLGFAWALVDEDTLGWHDRMSGTYVRSADCPSPPTPGGPGTPG